MFPVDSFHIISRLAARALRSPIALLSAVEGDRLEVVSSHGLITGSLGPTASCLRVMQSQRLLSLKEVSDAAMARATACPAGTRQHYAYIGVPIRSRSDEMAGVLSVWDPAPRSFDDYDEAALNDFAELVAYSIQARRRLDTELSARTEELRARNRALQKQIDESAGLQREQRMAERRLRNIANSVPATIGYWNRDLRCEFANDAHRMWFGPLDREIVGMTMQELQKPELFKQNEPHIRRALAGESQHFERELRRADGSAATVDVQYRPDVEDSGEVRGFYVLVTDITAIRTARDEALRLAQAKTEFLANMSHEIRTPLNGVLGTNQLLLETPLSTEQRELATTSKACGEHLLAVVNDILDFSKIESGRLVLEKIEFDLVDCMVRMCEAVSPNARTKGLGFDVQVSIGAHHRLGDPTRLRQVVLNLVTNAIKFTSSGSVSVAIEGGDVPSNIRISIADTGIGMSAEELPRVFERFSQADSSTSRRFGGSGLGLAICRRLVEFMGGQLHVSSTQGVGSRFWFEIPLPFAPTADMKPRTVTSEPSKPPELEGMRVLVAEDNPVNQMLVRRMLQRLGCNVTLVANGNDAVDAWASSVFDVVLMDCQMPESDGFEATRRIRAMGSSGADVPILALTASAMDADREQALAAGMTDFLTKPLLAQTLADALSRAHQTAAGALS